jgi:hypothetical protein
MKATLVLALLPLIVATPTPNNHGNLKPKPAPGLGDLAKKAGLKYFGTAIDNVVLNNTKYTNIAFNRSEFNQVTPSNGQKWIHIEPQRNVFNYTLGDQVVDPSKKAGQMRRCHTFLWHSQLPDWVNNGNWTKTELLSILETHIKNEADYYWSDCYAWDVVNEAFLVRPSIKTPLYPTLLTKVSRMTAHSAPPSGTPPSAPATSKPHSASRANTHPPARNCTTTTMVSSASTTNPSPSNPSCEISKPETSLSTASVYKLTSPSVARQHTPTCAPLRPCTRLWGWILRSRNSMSAWRCRRMEAVRRCRRRCMRMRRGRV